MKLVRARIVLPISQPAIENGAVALAGKRLAAAGHWTELRGLRHSGEVDLGETILLPGLINCHCHLDYTELAGKIPPQKTFADWIKALVALKAAWTEEDFARSWQRGAGMLLRNGVTTVADIESVPGLIPVMWEQTPLRVVSFRELISIKSAVKALMREASREWSVLPRKRAGLSPHAPYTASAELLQLAQAAARRHHWLLSTHVAESEEELTMFLHRCGPLYQWLKGQRDMSDCGGVSPVQHLERLGYLRKNLLAVHANCLTPGDAEILARRGVSVVHCPRSHAYFQHRSFPREELARAGVNLCLGTDSLASCHAQHGALELNLFTEMKVLASKSPGLSPGAILKMATVNGAQALGRRGELGELRPKALADVIAIPFAGSKRAAEEAVLHHTGNVAAVMIDGKWVWGMR